jgi:IS4 transposase
VIVIADRNYESYNVFAHIEQKGWKYVIRVKDRNSNGILSGLDLPMEDTFDFQISMILTRKQTNLVKANPTLYNIVPKKSTFDYLDLKINKFYPISLRIVRFKISETTYETIITNLDQEEFPIFKIKELYRMRWGIETSFRELKYSIGLTNFHSKKVEYIIQEIFARLTMYNFCELITLHVVIQQKDTKYGYQANFTAAIKICKYFFKCLNDASPPDVEALIQKNILPIRNGRSDPRKVKPRPAVSFLYRVA